ncbi:Glutathione S-transferase-like protein ustS [Colletotrichum sp. SAR 10_96]|nr:Glutathione S-transferase-like protein ustS [Colletotrichum sp. SAR 10_96]
MTSQPTPEVILYDLACTKNTCFSPAVWRIRLVLNYKRIPYGTVFLEFPDIEPTLSALNIPPYPQGKHKYTVPAIHHVPSDTHVMDSLPIAKFLEETYPSPALPQSTPRDAEIIAKLRDVAGPIAFASVTPREPGMLSPRAAEYFRRSREAGLGGKTLEDVLAGEEGVWEKAQEGLREFDELVKEVRGGKAFVGGDEPSLTDFFIAGGLQSMRTVDEGLFERYTKWENLKGVYEACVPWMDEKD